MNTTLRQNVQQKDRVWYIVDAQGKRLGTLATAIADTLRGKKRVDFTPHVDGGDHVIVLNAEKVLVSGQKETDKQYYRSSGYIGHLKSINLAELRKKNPSRILQHAVSGMLPKTKHRKQQLLRLHLVIGDKNPHEAQQPKPLEL
ncbi:MAG: 50S ribosomal protein L13 [Candidatus Gracilibacteria bacterium]|nr:50S ribosomal protein L13 [Candidatus Gracilibacteria bacterium]